MEYDEGDLRNADSSYESIKDLVQESSRISNHAGKEGVKRSMYSPHGVGLSPSLLATRPAQLRPRPSYTGAETMVKQGSSSSSSNGKRNSIVSSSDTSADTAKDAANRSNEAAALSRSSSLSSAKQLRPKKGADLDGRNQRFIASVNAHSTSPPMSPQQESSASPIERVYSTNLRRSVSLSSPDDVMEDAPSRRSSLRTSEIREEARARRQRSSVEPEEITSPSSGPEAFASKRASVVSAYRHSPRYSSPQAYDSPRFSESNYSASPRVDRRSRASESHYTPSRPASRAEYHHYRSPEERPSTSMSFRSPPQAFSETSPQTSQTISYSSNYNRQRQKTDSPTTRATNASRARIPVEFLRRSEEPESPRERSASPALSNASRLTSVSRQGRDGERWRRESSASISERGEKEYEEGRTRKRSLLSEQSSVSSQSNGSKDDIFGRTMHTPYGRSRSSTSPPSSILSSRHSQPRDDRAQAKGSSANDWLSEVQELRERIGALEVSRPVSSASSRSSGRRSDRHRRSNATAAPIREEHHRTIRPTTSHAVLSPHTRQPTFSNHSTEDLSRSDSYRRSPQTGLGSPYATLRERPTPRTPGHPPLPQSRPNTAEHQKLLLASWERLEDYRHERPSDDLPPEVFDKLFAMVEHTNSLNSGLRQMVAASIDAQVEAELEEESGRSADGSTFVKLERTAADLQRISDDQTRCLTDLLIGLGRHVRTAQPKSPVQARVNGVEHSSGRKGENARADIRAERQSISLGLPESPRSAEARPGPKTSQSSQQTIRPISSFISSPIARLARRASKASVPSPTLSLAHATSPQKDTFRQDRRSTSLDLDLDMVETPDTSFDLAHEQDRSPLARRESTSSFAVASLRNGLTRGDSRSSRAPSFS